MSGKTAGKVFVDSNIFLYALDRSSRRRELAKSRLLELSRSGRVVISTQVLNEIFSVATRKLSIDPVSAKNFVRQLYDFDVILVTPEIIDSAMDCAILNRLNYWDALMIAAAESARCPAIWTEDMDPGQVIRGVEVVNPLL
jgi:predicted nucleic acid-binding protein